MIDFKYMGDWLRYRQLERQGEGKDKSITYILVVSGCGRNAAFCHLLAYYALILETLNEKKKNRST